MSEDKLIERLRADLEFSDGRYLGNCGSDNIRILLDALAAKDTALSEWKASHARVVEGFMEVCEAVGVQFDAPEAVAYAINAKINNAEHDKVEAEAALSEMRVELEAAKHELSCCDDIPLDQGLVVGISELQTDRERLRTELGPDENPMVAFLLLMGIEPPDRRPEPCPHCGAEWPWCDWDSIIDKSPCANETPPKPISKAGG